MVLLDHGLYKQLDDDFRIRYALLWRSLMMADVRAIKEACKSLGVDEMVGSTLKSDSCRCLASSHL
jgi:aarF domain-containing kinase